MAIDWITGWGEVKINLLFHLTLSDMVMVTVNNDNEENDDDDDGGVADDKSWRVGRP